MRVFLHRLGMAYGSAIILMFFSEYFFVNESPVLELITTLKSNPLLAIPAFISFASFYVLFTYPFLVLVSYFNINTISGLLLAGAVFGWATEGLTIAIIYEAIPVSFLFPSIGWHALIDVIIGWYLVRLAMRRFGLFGNIILFITLGATWGAWATWYWDFSPNSEIMIPLIPADFMLLALVSSSFWFLGMFLGDRFSNNKFEVNKWEIIIIGLIYIILLPIIAFPYLPFSALIIPIVGVTIFAIWRGKNNNKRQTILQRLHSTRPAIKAYFAMILTPLTATLVYPLFYNANIQVPTDAIVQTLLLVSSIWFLYAVFRPFFARKNH